MRKNGHSSFWTTGIWVLLRYLALPIMILGAIYVFGGSSQRMRMNANAMAMVAPLQERVAMLLGRSETLQSRIHMRDPDISADTGTIRLSDLPVAAVVPVVKLTDLPEIEGETHVRLSDLPEPVDDTVYFLLTQPDSASEPARELAVLTSIRPYHRPILETEHGGDLEPPPSGAALGQSRSALAAQSLTQ